MVEGELNWIERLPALVEPAGGIPDTWRARLEDGSRVIVRRHREPGAGAAARGLAKLRSLAAPRSEHLLPVRGAAPDGSGISVIYDAEIGASLQQVGGGHALDAAAAVALAVDVLEGLAALHRLGQSHGDVSLEAVRVLPDGRACLWGYSPWSEGTGAAQIADVRSAAELLCAASGIPLEWDPADALHESERAAPAVAATLRAIARGSLSLDAGAAAAAIREASGHFGTDEAMQASHESLAPSAPPPAPSRLAPIAVSLTPLISRRPRTFAIAGAIAAGVIVLTAVGVVGWRTAAHPHRIVGRPAIASATPTPSAVTSPLPSAPPSSAGPVKSVTATLSGNCKLGSTCRIEVEVFFAKLEVPALVAWDFQLTDSCTQETTPATGSHVDAKKGWTHVIGDTEIELPAGHSLAIVAITSSPSQASAPPIVIQGSC